MSANVGKREFHFDCIVERPHAAPLGGRFAIVVALFLLLVAIAASYEVPRVQPREAGAPSAIRAA